jgi:cytochrome b subunit of formate dehydrogenase
MKYPKTLLNNVTNVFHYLMDFLKDLKFIKNDNLMGYFFNTHLYNNIMQFFWVIQLLRTLENYTIIVESHSLLCSWHIWLHWHCGTREKKNCLSFLEGLTNNKSRNSVWLKFNNLIQTNPCHWTYICLIMSSTISL